MLSLVLEAGTAPTLQMRKRRLREVKGLLLAAPERGPEASLLPVPSGCAPTEKPGRTLTPSGAEATPGDG